MTLLITMLPLYLIANLHCIGMCGPLVLMIGMHKFRNFYFWGRLLSFTLAGTIAGFFGAVIQMFFEYYKFPALLSFLFGGIVIVMGINALLGLNLPYQKKLAIFLAPFNQSLTLLILQEKAWPTFLFGFFTILLPCGQTIMVYSACALSYDAWVGTINGFAFALLTTPSLLAAMHAHTLIRSLKKYYHVSIGLSGMMIGGLAICRGIAQLELIPHLVFNPISFLQSHIVIYSTFQ